jgi:hypothetical protein
MIYMSYQSQHEPKGNKGGHTMIECLDKTQNRLALMLIKRKGDVEHMYEFIKKAKEHCKSICYVCLSNPYNEVIQNLTDEGIDSTDFTFVDVISSLHYPLQPITNCVFVPGPESLNEIKKAVHSVVQKKQCTAMIFDNISALLIYQQPDAIVKFTHDLIEDKEHQHINKVYVMKRDGDLYRKDINRLIEDLNLFADKVIEFE